MAAAESGDRGIRWFKRQSSTNSIRRLLTTCWEAGDRFRAQPKALNARTPGLEREGGHESTARAPSMRRLRQQALCRRPRRPPVSLAELERCCGTRRAARPVATSMPDSRRLRCRDRSRTGIDQPARWIARCLLSTPPHSTRWHRGGSRRSRRSRRPQRPSEHPDFALHRSCSSDPSGPTQAAGWTSAPGVTVSFTPHEIAPCWNE